MKSSPLINQPKGPPPTHTHTHIHFKCDTHIHMHKYLLVKTINFSSFLRHNLLNWTVERFQIPVRVSLRAFKSYFTQ